MKTKKRRQTRKARKVIERKSSKPGFLSDEEEIELRRQRAADEKAHVSRLDGNGEFYGIYEVGSSQWDQHYRVEIRSLKDRQNTCNCRDFFTNGLGTCKHIERTLQHISHRKKRSMQRAAAQGSPYHEIFLDGRLGSARVRLIEPANGRTKAGDVLKPFFGADGALLGDPLDAIPAIQRAVSSTHPKVRGRIRVSEGIGPWTDLMRKRKDRGEARAAFMEDVRRGKRDFNPVRWPLYPYQQEGMLHLAFGERAMLADEMGLGKTVQAIAACELLRQIRGIGRVLIVCPASLKAEWEDQIRHFSGRPSKLIYGPRAERLRTYREDHFYSIANYEQVRGDVEDINRYLAPDVVILDEAQRIKNWPTKTAKTIKRLSSPYAFVLTGTPLENRIEEVYSLVEFLDPLLFGALFRFQREFFEADDDGNVGHRNLNELHRRVNSVMLRRRKSDVEGELPERTTNTYIVGMAAEQRARYEDYETRAMRLIAQAQKRPLTKEEFEKLQRLLACMRMICDTPYILDRECRLCPKLEELESILDEVLDDDATKVIIFSEWVKMLELVKELAREKGIAFAEHTGQIDQRKRRDEIGRFKTEPACRLFLSSDSGSTGLNLQVANVVINLDLPWNPAKLEQRIARAWRKHQQRPVSVINLVTERSIEHGMLGTLAFKHQLAESVLDGKIPAGGLTSERGRKAFLKQVNELMGARIETGTEREEGAPTGPTEEQPARRLKEDLAARFPSRLLAIDATPDERAFVVIARRAEDAEEMRKAARAAVADAHVEVLDQQAYALLNRLQEQGIISFTAEVRNIFRAPELDSTEHDIQPPKRFPAEAMAHLASAERKRSMSRLLSEGTFHEEALAPIADAYEVSLEALHVLHQGSPPKTRVEDEQLKDLPLTSELPFDPVELRSSLRDEVTDAAAAELIREVEKAIASIESLMGKLSGR